MKISYIFALVAVLASGIAVGRSQSLGCDNPQVSEAGGDTALLKLVNRKKINVRVYPFTTQGTVGNMIHSGTRKRVRLAARVGVGVSDIWRRDKGPPRRYTTSVHRW